MFVLYWNPYGKADKTFDTAYVYIYNIIIKLYMVSFMIIKY